MLARKKTRKALLKIQAKPKDIRTVKQANKQMKQQQQQKKEGQKNIYKVITGSAVVDFIG